MIGGMHKLNAQVWTGSAVDPEDVVGEWLDVGNWQGGNVPYACGPLGCSGILIQGVKSARLSHDMTNGVPATHRSTPLIVGGSSYGKLLIDGGIISSGAQSIIGGGTASGLPAGSEDGEGYVEVLNGGRWNIFSSNARVGDMGDGSLTISTGGIVNVSNTSGTLTNINLAVGENSSGYIYIGSSDVAREAGTLNAKSIVFGAGDGGVVFNHINSDYDFGASFVSSGLINVLSGTTRFTSSSLSFTGIATIGSGARLSFAHEVEFGDKADRTAVVQVNDGIFSTGSINGRNSPINFTIHGDLRFTPNSIIEVAAGAPGADSHSDGVADLIHVTGSLLLDGTLKLSNLGDFSFGRYELFRFGSLHADDNHAGVVLDIGGLNGSLIVEGSSIYLLVAQALGSSAYWRGGDGTWNTSGAEWSASDDGSNPLFPWNDGVAVFGVLGGGQVDVEGDVVFNEIQFTADDYLIGGDGRLIGVLADEQTYIGLQADQGVSAHIAAQIEADAVLRKYGPGTVILSHDGNSWVGTRVEAGILQIGSGDAASVGGRLSGDTYIGTAGTLVFNHANDAPYAGAISGEGRIRLDGGSLTLTGANTYLGGTEINGGRLQVGGGGGSGSLGSGAVTLAVGATLAFARNSDITVSNAISGGGTIEQMGADGTTLTLSGNLDGFTGALEQISGRLVVTSDKFGGSVMVSDRFVLGSADDSGAISGAVDVGSGGRFSGTGSVGGLSLRSGSSIAPGHSIGVIEVTGDALFEAGSIYEVEVDPSVAADAPWGVAGYRSSDRIDVRGTATIEGGNVVSLAPGSGWQPNTRFIILTAGTLDGEFEAVSSDRPFLSASLEHDTNLGVVALVLDRNDIDFAGVAASPNQAAAAAALQSLTGGHPLFMEVFGIIEGSTTAEAQNAFAQLSGEYHASVRNMLLDDSRFIRDAVLAHAGTAMNGGNRVWMRALHHDADFEDDATADFSRKASGVLLGVDYALGESSSAGWSTGYQRTTADAAWLASEGDVNTLHAAVHGGTRLGFSMPGFSTEGMGLRFGAAYAWHEVDVQRQVAFGGYTESMRSEYDANTLQAFGELDLHTQIGDFELSPFLNVAWVRLSVDAFEEADHTTDVMGGTAVLTSGSASTNATFATLGARGVLPLGPVHLQGMLGWKSTLSGDDAETRVSFLNGGDAFSLRGAPIAKNAFVADVGLDIALGSSARVGVAYAGQLSSEVTDHALRANLHITLP